MSESIRIEIRRVIRATPARLFAAWTEPDQLRAWWGPAGVSCSAAEIDLRVGGRYRITNAVPGGGEVIIAGVFERIEIDRELVYTWSVGGAAAPSRVIVRFEPRGPETTEVVVVHERIADRSTADDHRGGWVGCLDGLVGYAEA